MWNTPRERNSLATLTSRPRFKDTSLESAGRSGRFLAANRSGCVHDNTAHPSHARYATHHRAYPLPNKESGVRYIQRTPGPGLNVPPGRLRASPACTLRSVCSHG